MPSMSSWKDESFPKIDMPSMSSWKDEIFLKIVNVIVCFVFIGSNVYTVAGPEGIYKAGKETYFTPAPYAFVIWFIIDLLLLGTIVYQFFDAGKGVIIDGIGWLFPISAILSSIFVGLRSQQHYSVAFTVTLLVRLTSLFIYAIVKRCYPSESLHDELWVHLPFSLYYGWTSVLNFLAVFEAFGVNALTHKPGLDTKVAVFIVLAGLQIPFDFGISITTTWGLFAIFAHQHHPFIRWSVLAFSIISLLCTLAFVLGHILLWLARSGGILHDAERAPILLDN